MKWIALIGALAVLLAFDLWLARRERHAGMSVRTATLQSIGWVVVALGFGGVHAHAARRPRRPACTSPATWSRSRCRWTTSSSSC